MDSQQTVDLFDQARPRLLGLAYRILGSLADAEDAVQDTYLQWQRTTAGSIENPAAWLTTVCTRRCLDMMRAAHKSRVEYVGAWLPEPIQTASDETPEHQAELASSLTTAFLLMLERLTPRERAAFLLRDIFDMSYREIADALEIKEDACRKLVSRAKINVNSDAIRHRTSPDARQRLLSAFRSAVTGGSTEHLTALLSAEIRLAADGGGKVPTIPRILTGVDEVMAMVSGPLRKFWDGLNFAETELNGEPGFVVTKDGEAHAIVNFALNAAGEIDGIFIMRNPDKMTGLKSLDIC